MSEKWRCMMWKITNYTLAIVYSCTTPAVFSELHDQLASIWVADALTVCCSWVSCLKLLHRTLLCFLSGCGTWFYGVTIVSVLRSEAIIFGIIFFIFVVKWVLGVVHAKNYGVVPEFVNVIYIFIRHKGSNDSRQTDTQTHYNKHN